MQANLSNDLHHRLQFANGVWLSEKLHDTVQKLAQNKERSMAYIVREILQERLSRLSAKDAQKGKLRSKDFSYQVHTNSKLHEKLQGVAEKYQRSVSEVIRACLNLEFFQT